MTEKSLEEFIESSINNMKAAMDEAKAEAASAREKANTNRAAKVADEAEAVAELAWDAEVALACALEAAEEAANKVANAKAAIANFQDAFRRYNSKKQNKNRTKLCE